MFIYRNRRGFLLVEIILSVATIGVIALALGGLFAQGRDSAQVSGKRTVALFLAEEGLEAVRSIRDEGFINLLQELDDSHGLELVGERWSLTDSPDVIDDTYTRTVVITLDSENKLDVSVTIAWSQNTFRNGTITLESRITNWREEVVPEDEV